MPRNALVVKSDNGIDLDFLVFSQVLNVLLNLVSYHDGAPSPRPILDFVFVEDAQVLKSKELSCFFHLFKPGFSDIVVVSSAQAQKVQFVFFLEIDDAWGKEPK
jgi:hypothetical protein